MSLLHPARPDDEAAPAPAKEGAGPLWACGGALVVIALFRRLVPADSDTPWHLAEGHLLLRRWGAGGWQIGRRDSFSWTAHGAPWQPNSWGFDGLFAVVYDLGGWVGVALFRVVLLAGIVALAWAFTRRSGAGPWARAGAVWIAVVLVIPSGALRPQLASFVLLLGCLELTERFLAAGAAPAEPVDPEVTRRRTVPGGRLLALALLFAAWSSLHGAVIVGVAAVAAAAAGHALQTGTWRRPAGAVLVAAAASCASPLGIGVWTYALRNGGESRREGIQEWQPPSIHRAADVGVLVLLVVILVLTAWRVRSGRTEVRWSVAAPFGLATALSFLAVRNATFAVLASAPLLADLLAATGSWLERQGWALPVHPGRALAAMTVGGIVAGAIQTGVLTLQPDPSGAPEYPTAAARALPGGCRVLNEYHFGGYLILERPDVPVSQDGRNDLYGAKRLDEQEHLFTIGDPSTAASELDRAGITCVLAEPSRPLVRALANDPTWRRVEADASAQAWVRT